MTKYLALKVIDEHKNKLIDPIEMLNWVHLRVIIAQIKEEDWDEYVEQAEKILSR